MENKKDLKDEEVLFKDYFDNLGKIISDSFNVVYDNNKDYFDVNSLEDFAKKVNIDDILSKIQIISKEIGENIRKKEEEKSNCKTGNNTKKESNTKEESKCNCSENSECRKTGKCCCKKQNKKADVPEDQNSSKPIIIKIEPTVGLSAKELSEGTPSIETFLKGRDRVKEAEECRHFVNQINRPRDILKTCYIDKNPKEVVFDEIPKLNNLNTSREDKVNKNNNKEKIMNILFDFKDNKEKDNVTELNKLSKQYIETQEEIDRLNKELDKIAYKLLECKDKEQRVEKTNNSEKILKKTDEIKETILDICKPLGCLNYDDVVVFDENKKILSYKIIITTEEEPYNMRWKQYLYLNSYINDCSIPICVIFYHKNSIDNLEIKNKGYAKKENKPKEEKQIEIILTREHDDGNILAISKKDINSSLETREKIEEIITCILNEVEGNLLVLI